MNTLLLLAEGPTTSPTAVLKTTLLTVDEIGLQGVWLSVKFPSPEIRPTPDLLEQPSVGVILWRIGAKPSADKIIP